MTEWRQSAYHVRQFKKSYRHIQKLKHSTSKDEGKRQVKQAAIRDAHQVYLEQAEGYLERARATRGRLANDCGVAAVLLVSLEVYMSHAERQIDQIRRRVLWVLQAPLTGTRSTSGSTTQIAPLSARFSKRPRPAMITTPWSYSRAPS